VTAERIEKAIHKVYKEGRHLRRDFGGNATTDEFPSAVIVALTALRG
jgi:isocitrate/isopropylmalate dehydrogenase